MSSSDSRLRSLQAYRGIAAMLVLMCHGTALCREHFGTTFLHNFFQFGYSGVDFFFVLSGFIILHLHGRDLGQPGRWRNYALKRLLRVFPIYLVATLLVLPVYFIHPAYGTGHEREPMTILRSLLLWPQPANQFPVITVAWTLSHEMWFYFLFSCAILLPKRLTMIGAAVLVSASLLLWILELTLHRDPSAIAYPHGFWLSSYNLEFALGCLASALVSRCRIRAHDLCIAAGAVLFLTSGWFDPWLIRHFGNAHRVLSYGVPSFLIVLGSVSREMYASLPVANWLVFLGDASYSIYLVHVLPMSIAWKLALRLHLVSSIGSFATVLAMIGGATVIACAFYWFVERPLLTFLRRFLPKPPRAAPRPMPPGAVPAPSATPA